MLDAGTLAVDESGQPWTGVALRLMLRENLQDHYQIAVNVLFERAREGEWSRTSAVVAVDSAMGYTAERSTGVFEAASARTIPHESREVVYVRDGEHTKLTLHW